MLKDTNKNRERWRTVLRLSHTSGLTLAEQWETFEGFQESLDNPPDSIYKLRINPKATHIGPEFARWLLEGERWADKKKEEILERGGIPCLVKTCESEALENQKRCEECQRGNRERQQKHRDKK